MWNSSGGKYWSEEHGPRDNCHGSCCVNACVIINGDGATGANHVDDFIPYLALHSQVSKPRPTGRRETGGRLTG